MATRSGTAEWKGDLKGGMGAVKVASGLFDGNYSFRTRFENEPGTNPEELVAAAHAACFSMALSNILAEAGHKPRSVKTTANVELGNVDGKPTLNKITLVTQGDVPGIDQSEFDGYANQAKEDCPISRALAGVKEMTLDATLV